MIGSITGALMGGIKSGITYARTTPLLRSVSKNEFKSIKSIGDMLEFIKNFGSFEVYSATLLAGIWLEALFSSYFQVFLSFSLFKH